MTDKSTKIWIGTTLAVLALNLAFRAGNYLTVAGDMGLYLQCGKMLINGARPYVDFIDTNPPLVMYASAVPAALSRFCHFGLIDAFQLAVFLFICLCLFLTGWIMLRLAPDAERPLAGPLLLSLALLCLATMTDYGQREFLFVFSYVPFWLLRWSRAQGGEDAVPRQFDVVSFFTGILAGFGLAFKPFFLVLPAMAEAYWLWRKRSVSWLIKPETIGCAVFLALYGLHFFLLPADCQKEFFGFLSPLMVRSFDVYNATVPFFLEPLWIPRSVFLLIAVICGMTIWKKTTLAAPLLIQLVASVILILLQAKNWSYYGTPMLAFSFMLALIPFALGEGRRVLKASAAAAFCLIYTVLQGLWLRKVAAEVPYEFRDTVLSNCHPGDRVLYLDTTSWPWYSFAANYDLQPACRYLWLFPVTMIEYDKTRDPSRVQQYDDELNGIIANIAGDAQKNSPRLIVVHTNKCYRMPEEFNLHDYLSKRGLAGLFSGCTELTPTAHYRYYSPANK